MPYQSRGSHHEKNHPPPPSHGRRLGAGMPESHIHPAAFGLTPNTCTVTAFILVSYIVIQRPFYLILIHHTLRQLKLIASIYATVKQINLFQLFPVYAFSSLTARTGLAIIFLIYYTYFFFYYLNLRGESLGFLGFLALIAFLLLALACFVFPLYGIHLRLAQEKSRRLELALSDLHQRVDGGEYEKGAIYENAP